MKEYDVDVKFKVAAAANDMNKVYTLTLYVEAHNKHEASERAREIFNEYTKEYFVEKWRSCDIVDIIVYDYEEVIE